MPRNRLLTTLSWGTLITNLVAWYVIRQADDWSLATLLSYGPRWVWLLPPLVLLPSASFRKARTLPLLIAMLVAAIPILQFEFGRLSPAHGQGTVLKIVSMNAASKANASALRGLVERERPDVVALQEWARPKERLAIPGYTLECVEGLCVLSRFPLEPAGALDRREIGGWNMIAARTRVHADTGPLTVVNVHLETVREGIEAIQHGENDALREMEGNINFRDFESRIVSEWIASTPGPLLIAGDFNLPVDSVIYRKHWTRWSNAFSVAGWGYGWTKFTRWWGIRIDHILFDAAQWQVLDARAGEDAGSDHRPVIARLRRR